MRLGIMSDTHGSLEAWRRALEVMGDVDMILHAGDVLYHGPKNPLPGGHDAMGLAVAMNQYPGRIVIARGNCDAEVDEKVLEAPIMAPHAFVAAEGRFIVVAHGHLLAPEDMPALVRRYRADLLVVGHSHVPGIAEVPGTPSALILNPGSPALPKTPDRRGTIAVADDWGLRILHLDDATEFEARAW